MLIEYYKAIEDSSAKMLHAAMRMDWEVVLQCESACSVLIEQLRLKSKSEVLDSEAKAEKSKIMLRILQNDAQIRQFTESWVEHLSASAIPSHTLH